MNQRERWIVYPLLFFALGAALRDKYTQSVQTGELHASQITCEDIAVIDPETPNRIVARLTSRPLGDSTSGNAGRYGVLALIDSAGKELCGVTNNQLQVREIACQGLFVIDPDNGKTLARLGSGLLQSDPQARPERIGTLVLNNQDFGSLMTAPPKKGQAPPKPRPPESEAPAAEPPAEAAEPAGESTDAS
jgi:hypothetical protein